MILKIFVLVSSTLICCYSVFSTSCPKSQYTELQGTIASPGFNTSESYGENMSCVYSINLPPGRRIILELKTLSILGTMPNCPEDSLEIFVGWFACYAIAAILVDVNNRPLKADFHWCQSPSLKRAYDPVKIKNESYEWIQKLDGIRVRRIRTFPFSSNSAYDSAAYDLVKTRLSESEAVVQESTNQPS